MGTKETSPANKARPDKKPPRIQPKTAPVTTDTASTELNPAELERLPNHPTTRPLRQAQIQRWQRQYGNAYVQRLLAGPTETLAADQNPEVIQAKLGEGHSLDGTTRNRMESAFGTSFGRVKVHTGDQAAQLSADLDAHAFTVGDHVAFGAGAYRPGSPVGDALIAHELAHVQQQRGAPAGQFAPLRRDDTGHSAYEADADRSATQVMLSLWGGARGYAVGLAQNALPRLRSGLSLRRCDKDKAKEVEGSKAAEVVKEPKLLTDFGDKFSGSADMIRKNKDAMKLVNEADKAGVKFGGYAEDGPHKDTWPYTSGDTVYIPKARTDKVVAMSDFLFELNNAVRKPAFAKLQEEAKKGSKGKLTAKQYAYQILSLELEGMLRSGEIWFKMKKELGKDPKWDKYDDDFFLSIYKDYHDGKKTKDQIVKEMLNWKYTTGVDKGKTHEQYYMEAYKSLSGGK